MGRTSPSDGEGDAVGVHHLAPVQVSPGQTVDQQLSGGHVGGHGDGVLVTQLGDGQHAVVQLSGAGVVEEQHHVDLVVDDALTDLLDAAVGVGQEQIDRKTGGLRDHAAGGVGGAYGVLGQDAAVSSAELDHQFLLMVVAHQCDVHGVANLLYTDAGREFSGSA